MNSPESPQKPEGEAPKDIQLPDTDLNSSQTPVLLPPESDDSSFTEKMGRMANKYNLLWFVPPVVLISAIIYLGKSYLEQKAIQPNQPDSQTQENIVKREIVQNLDSSNPDFEYALQINILAREVRNRGIIIAEKRDILVGYALQSIGKSSSVALGNYTIDTQDQAAQAIESTFHFLEEDKNKLINLQKELADKGIHSQVIASSLRDLAQIYQIPPRHVLLLNMVRQQKGLTPILANQPISNTTQIYIDTISTKKATQKENNISNIKLENFLAFLFFSGLAITVIKNIGGKKK